MPRSSVSLSTVVSGCGASSPPVRFTCASGGASDAQTRWTVDFEQPTRRAVSVTPSFGNISTIAFRSDSESLMTLPIRLGSFLLAG